MMEFAGILLAAAAAMGLARLLHLPSVPLLVLAGLGLKLSGVLPDELLVENVVELGLAFLVFILGSELNPQRIGAQRRAALKIGLTQFVTLTGIGLFATWLLGFGLREAAYLGLALAASSTLVVVTLLRQRQQSFEPFGRLVAGVLLLQDLLIIVLLAAMSGVDDGVSGVAIGLASVAGLMVLAWLGLRWVIPWLLVTLELDEEGQLLTILAVLFIFGGLAHLTGLHFVIGAFLGGVALSSFPVNGVIRGHLSSLSDFFLAVFFVSLGALLVLPGWREVVLVVLLAVLVLVVTPPLVAWIAHRAGLTGRSSIEAGLLLAQCSEFSVLVALLGREQGHLDGNMLPVIVLIAVVTMILTPFIATDAMTWRLVWWMPSPPEPQGAARPSGHVLLLGCGDNGRDILQELVAEGRQVVVVDADPAVVESLRQMYPAEGKGAPPQVLAYRGDGADYRMLRLAAARSAGIIISTMRRLQDNERLLRFVRDVPVLVRVFAPEEGERIERAGGRAIVYSDAAAKHFLNWFAIVREHMETREASNQGGTTTA